MVACPAELYEKLRRQSIQIIISDGLNAKSEEDWKVCAEFESVLWSGSVIACFMKLWTYSSAL